MTYSLVEIDSGDPEFGGAKNFEDLTGTTPIREQAAPNLGVQPKILLGGRAG